MTQNVFVNRELSWIKFNERVLEEAENKENSLEERLSFIYIYQNNLDEFFQVRVGSLQDLINLGNDERDNKTNMTPKKQISKISKQVKKLSTRQSNAYLEVMKELMDRNIHLINFQNLIDNENEYLKKYYELEIAPFIFPSVIDDNLPFPYLRDKEIYAVAVLENKKGKRKMGIIPCTNNVVKRLIELPKRMGNFLLSEEIILHFCPLIFKGYRVIEKSLIRVTRNADIDVDAFYDEELNYRDFMAQVIKRRRKLAPIRLELSRVLGDKTVEYLRKSLGVAKNRVYTGQIPLDLSFLSEFQKRIKSESNEPKRVPQKSPMFVENQSIIEQIQKEDKALFYPFESMKTFINLLYEAANDKKVLSIKMTLYRLASNSKIVDALTQAAENGKKVELLVELRARFDEENNIEWSRRLEDAGCHIIYGIEGYKVHSKLCLITRKTKDGIQYVTQIGTGNYNEKTSEIYTDISVLTANPEIAADAENVFDCLCMEKFVEQSNHLLVAPLCLRNPILKMIDEEIEIAKEGKPAYIGLKLNSLTDKKIMEKLIEASKAGVKIDMVIRGICCLLPQVKGETENIRVISIVGKYLEHSRIYIFGTKDRQKIYISSADFMTRNTVKRVEVAAPVYDQKIQAKLNFIFDTLLADNCKARELLPNGEYEFIHNDQQKVNAQETFYRLAYEANSDKKNKKT